MPHALCLQFDLEVPDYWLAHRLADLSCLLSHPDDAFCGAGPFRLASFASELVRLEQHAYYHLQRPFLAAIEFWITPQLFAQRDNVSCQHPVRIMLGEQDELADVKPVKRSTSLGFCYIAANLRRQHLTPEQAQKVVMIIQRSGLLNHLPIDHDLVKPSREMLPEWPIPEHQADGVVLPKTLRLLFHPPVELEFVAQALQVALLAENCQLEIIYHQGRVWDDESGINQADLILGDRLIGEAPEATLENWLRQDMLWSGILSDEDLAQQAQRLKTIQQLPLADKRAEELRDHFYHLMKRGSITPLFNYQYQVSAPPRVNGVQLTAWGWFDFYQAWIPPPLS